MEFQVTKRGPKTKDPMARFMAKVDKHGPVPPHRPDLGPCWVWTAFRNHLGYGRFSANVDGRRSQAQAHRWLYEQLLGPIAAGLEPDHLCRNRACVNPAHLEPVTRQENILRGTSFAAQRAVQTHCIHGHEFTEANTYIRLDRGTRECRRCLAERVGRFLKKKRAAEPA